MGRPSTVTGVPSATLSSGPLGRAPPTWTRPTLTNALASFRDHWPVAANSLSNRSMVSPLLYPLFSPLYHIFSAVDIE